MKLALVPIALAALLVAGCGGSSSSSSSPSPQDWADSLCSSITTWSNSVKTAGESLKSGSLSKGDLKNTTSEIKSATNTFADDLKGLGKPDTEGGDKAKSTLDTLSDQLTQDVDSIKKAADDASAGSGGIVKAISSVSATLTTAGNQVQTAFSSLQQLDTKGELEKAFENSASCKKLTSSSG